MLMLATKFSFWGTKLRTEQLCSKINFFSLETKKGPPADEKGPTTTSSWRIKIAEKKFFFTNSWKQIWRLDAAKILHPYLAWTLWFFVVMACHKLRPILRGKSSEENSTHQNFSKLYYKLFPMFLGLSVNSLQAEQISTLKILYRIGSRSKEVFRVVGLLISCYWRYSLPNF